MKFSRAIPADSPRELHHTQSLGKQQISFHKLLVVQWYVTTYMKVLWF